MPLRLIIALYAATIAALLLAGCGAPPEPAPTPSSTPTHSSECTAEDLSDGACLTWDDIRDAEWQTGRGK